MDVDKLLAERHKTHGDYTDTAATIQGLKAVAHRSPNWSSGRMSADQRESVDMILHKVGRLLCGDPEHADSWEDIIGYAKLALDRLPGKR